MERLPPTQPFTSALSLSSPTLESPRASMTPPLGLVPQSPGHSLHSPLTLSANHVGRWGNVVVFPRSGSITSPSLPLSPYDTGHPQSHGLVGTSAYPTHGGITPSPSSMMPVTSSGEDPQPDSASALASPNLPVPPSTVSTAAVGTGSSTPPKREGSSTSSCEGKL